MALIEKHQRIVLLRQSAHIAVRVCVCVCVCVYIHILICRASPYTDSTQDVWETAAPPQRACNLAPPSPPTEKGETLHLLPPLPGPTTAFSRPQQ